MYKPFGVLSQLTSNDLKETRKKRFLGAFHSFPEGMMPVGRLDEKSEGLLLITSNGKWSDHINRSGVEKEYYAQLDGEITDAALEKLRQGVEIGVAGAKYITKPCMAHRLETLPNVTAPHPKMRIGTHRPNTWISITITEGKFRQVRKMTAAVGYPTLRLIRVRIGSMTLENLLPGQVEVCDLRNLL